MADDNNIYIGAHIDLSKLNEEAGKIDDIFARIARNAKATGEEVDKVYQALIALIAKYFDELDKSMNAVVASIEKTRREIEGLQNMAKNADVDNTSLKAIQDSIAAKQKQIEEHQKEIELIKQANKELQEELDRIKAIAQAQKDAANNGQGGGIWSPRSDGKIGYNPSADPNNPQNRRLNVGTFPDPPTDKYAAFMQRLREITHEMTVMRFEGKQNTEEYAKLAEEFEKMTRAQRGMRKERNVAGNANAGLQGMIQGFSGVAGAISVAQGAMGMFAGESENLVKVLIKVQSIMAVTNGLQTVANTLHKDSAFRLKTLTQIQNLWQKGLDMTSKALTKMGMGARAARGAAIALNSALSLGIGAAIAIAVTAINKLIEKFNKAKAEQNAFNEAVAQSAAEPIFQIRRMADEWSKLDMEEKERYVLDNADAFKELGVAITSVADAENLLVNQKDAFISAMMDKAKAAAAQQMAQQKASEYIQKQIELEDLEKEQAKIASEIAKGGWTSRLLSIGGQLVKAQTGQDALELLGNNIKQKREELKTDMQNLNNDIEKYFKMGSDFQNKSDKELEDAGITTTKIVEGSVAHYDQMISALQDRKKRLTDTTGQSAKAIDNEIKKLEEARDKILGKEKKQKEEKRETYADTLNKIKQVYDQIALFRNSTDTQIQQEAERQFEKMKEQGEDFVDYLKKLRDKLGDSITEEQSAAINTALAQATQKKEEKAAKTALDAALEHYKTYERAKAELDEQYLKERGALVAAGYDEEAKMADKKYKEQLLQMQKEYGKLDTSLLATVMEDASRQTREELDANIKKVQLLLSYMRASATEKQNIELPDGIDAKVLENMNVDDIQKLTEQLTKMQEAYFADTYYPFSNIVQGLKLTKEAEDNFKAAEREAEKGNVEMAKSYRKAGEELQKMAEGKFLTAISDGLDFTKQLAESMHNLGEAVDNVDFVRFAKGLSDAVEMGQSILQGYQSGGVWGAIISGVGTAVNKVIQGISDKRAEREAYETSQLKFQNEYNKLLRERNYLEEEYYGILGQDKLGRVASAWEEAQKALKEYNDYVNAAITSKDQVYDAFEQKWGVKADGIEKKLLDMAYASYQDIGNGNMLKNIAVKTHTAKRWKIGDEDKYENLGDLAPQLWDENDEFDTEAARKFLETNKLITEEQRDQIQQAIDLKEQYEEATEVVKNMASEIAGQMYTDMTDAIVDAVENGADAWQDFEDSGAKAIKALGKQMVQSLIYNNFLKKYEEDIATALGKGDQNGVIDIIGRIGQEMPQMYEAGQALLKEVYDAGERMNYQMYNLDEQNRTASAKGIAQASQDSIDELNGRMTAVQSHTFNISQNSNELVANTASILRTLTGISSDTARLVKIEEALLAIRSDVGQVVTKGVRAI